MMSVISRLRDREREGFTLIELLVVVLIIGILAAIAVPTFLGQRKRAQDRSAQSDLRNTLLAAKTIYTDKQDYTVLNTDGNSDGESDALSAVEPAITFRVSATADSVANDAANANPGEVVVFAADKDNFIAAAKSASGDYFCLQDNIQKGTEYGDTITDDGDCTGTPWAGGDTSPSTTAP